MLYNKLYSIVYWYAMLNLKLRMKILLIREHLYIEWAGINIK